MRRRLGGRAAGDSLGGVPQPRKTKTPPKRESADGAARLAALRDALARGLVLTRERVNDTLDDAVRRGRMTREDAEELAASLVGVGRRQAQDLLSDVEQLLGRSRARTAEGTDALVRQVDRARRAAGIGPTFPILGYDELTAAQVAERLTDLTPAELRKVRDHERRNANRKSVFTAIERALR
jgi:polyhydroxyalkanoate synthesis regulator phasin